MNFQEASSSSFNRYINLQEALSSSQTHTIVQARRLYEHIFNDDTNINFTNGHAGCFRKQLIKCLKKKTYCVALATKFDFSCGSVECFDSF